MGRPGDRNPGRQPVLSFGEEPAPSENPRRPALAHPVRLKAVATASPPHILLQRDVAAVAHEMFGSRYEAFERLSCVFGTAGIIKRHAIRPMEWFAEPRGWPERTEVYLEGAVALFIESASKALEVAGLSASE